MEELPPDRASCFVACRGEGCTFRCPPRIPVRPDRAGWLVAVEGVDVVHLHDVGYGGALCGASGRRAVAAPGKPTCKRCATIANDRGVAGWLYAPDMGGVS